LRHLSREVHLVNPRALRTLLAFLIPGQRIFEKRPGFRRRQIAIRTLDVVPRAAAKESARRMERLNPTLASQRAW